MSKILNDSVVVNDNASDDIGPVFFYVSGEQVNLIQ